MVYAMVSLGVLVSFAALAIDVGYMYCSVSGQVRHSGGLI